MSSALWLLLWYFELEHCDWESSSGTVSSSGDGSFEHCSASVALSLVAFSVDIDGRKL